MKTHFGRYFPLVYVLLVFSLSIACSRGKAEDGATGPGWVMSIQRTEAKSALVLFKKANGDVLELKFPDGFSDEWRGEYCDIEYTHWNDAYYVRGITLLAKPADPATK